jgi:hypothetical protein
VSSAAPSLSPPLAGSTGRRVASAGAPNTRVPWFIWTGVLAVTSATIGGSWDVAWHRSIGRDTFWTPAHMAIYLCGVLAGIVGVWLTARATFGRDAALRAQSVRIFGLRAPLGVFMAGWGGLAMLTSAPFDNWWHDAYGLDVKIVSPPHTLLIFGIRMVSFGMLFLILAAMNRAEAAGERNFSTLQKLFLYLGGLAVGGQMFFLQEYTQDVALHMVTAYIAMAIALPAVFATIARASRFRWAATTAASVYMLFVMAEILVFPLFHAEPKLGPVYFPVTHLVPAKFPILIVAPALALDLLWQRTRAWKLWQVALLSGVIFVAVLWAVEWPFASFLMTHAAENRFFGTMYHTYTARPQNYDRMRIFFEPDSGARLAWGLARASLYGAISAFLGLAFGNWMRRVQR